MKPRTFDPLRLDVARFATEAAELDGEWPQAELPRLADSLLPTDVAQPPVRWTVQGSLRRRAGAAAQPWLRVSADTVATLQCQRCLQALHEPLAVARDFRFVASEADAEAEDPDSEEDLLVLSRSLDLRALVEDELILALPLVPRHDSCPEPLPVGDAPAAAGDEEDARPHPFAALAALKRRPPGG